MKILEHKENLKEFCPNTHMLPTLALPLLSLHLPSPTPVHLATLLAIHQPISFFKICSLFTCFVLYDLQQPILFHLYHIPKGR